MFTSEFAMVPVLTNTARYRFLRVLADNSRNDDPASDSFVLVLLIPLWSSLRFEIEKYSVSRVSLR